MRDTADLPDGIVSEPLTTAIDGPDGRLRVRLIWIESNHIGLRERRVPGYMVELDGRPLLRPSRLGVHLEGQPPLTGPFELVGEQRATSDTTRPTPLGEHAESRDRHVEVTLRLRETVRPGRELAVTLRLFDDGNSHAGFAVRYTLPPELRGVPIEKEATEFGLPDEATTFSGTWWEDPYHRRPAEQVLPDTWFPVTAELDDGRCVCIAEADVREFSAGRLRWHHNARRPGSGRLRVELAAPCVARADGTTPWRVVLVADGAAGLIGRAHQLENLCPPGPPDAGWVVPGKIMREVTLSTPGARAVIDFAGPRGLRYLLFDAGWYGHEYDEQPRATRVDVDPRRVREQFGDGDSPGLDLPGVKFGFVNVGPAGWTRWLHRAVEAAAERRLLVNVHDAYRPTGLSRTYPNLLTVEGVRGNEHHPGAENNLTLTYTRGVIGAADYTVCFRHPKDDTSDAHQMGLPLLVPSPLLTLFWYMKPSDYEDAGRAMEWFDALPTTWDESRGLSGTVGRSAVVARRKDNRWFVAATGEDAADRPLPADLASLKSLYDYRDHGGRVRILAAN